MVILGGWVFLMSELPPYVCVWVDDLWGQSGTKECRGTSLIRKCSHPDVPPTTLGIGLR